MISYILIQVQVIAVSACCCITTLVYSTSKKRLMKQAETEKKLKSEVKSLKDLLDSRNCETCIMRMQLQKPITGDTGVTKAIKDVRCKTSELNHDMDSMFDKIVK